MMKKQSIAVTLAINPHKHPEIYRRIEAMHSRARPSHILLLLAQKSNAVKAEFIGDDHQAEKNADKAPTGVTPDTVKWAQSNTSTSDATKPTSALIDPSMLVGVFGSTDD
jgi:tryptophan 2,3-dioxygenase